MSAATRWKILVLSALPFLLGSVLLYLLTQINIVEKDPIPFDGRKLKATYQSDAGEVKLVWSKENARYEVSGLLSGALVVDKQGTTPTGDGAAYTPFWLHFSNPVLTVDPHNPEFPLIDNVGVLGVPGLRYTARQEGTLILMDDILQSQASNRYGIFDMAGNRAASAIYDGTCGLLFRLQVKQPNKPDLRLVDTNFPISRNRVTLVIFNVLLIIGLVFLLRRRARALDGPASVYAMDEMWLVLLGSVCLATDTLVDIWYPFAFGTIVPVIWHALLIVPLVRIRRSAYIPLLAEIIMGFSYWIFLSGPARAYFFVPGATVAFVYALRGRRKPAEA